MYTHLENEIALKNGISLLLLVIIIIAINIAILSHALEVKLARHSPWISRKVPDSSWLVPG